MNEENILEYIKFVAEKADYLYEETLNLHPSTEIIEINIELTIQTP